MHLPDVYKIPFLDLWTRTVPKLIPKMSSSFRNETKQGCLALKAGIELLRIAGIPPSSGAKAPPTCNETDVKHIDRGYTGIEN